MLFFECSLLRSRPNGDMRNIALNTADVRMSSFRQIEAHSQWYVMFILRLRMLLLLLSAIPAAPLFTAMSSN